MCPSHPLRCSCHHPTSGWTTEEHLPSTILHEGKVKTKVKRTMSLRSIMLIVIQQPSRHQDHVHSLVGTINYSTPLRELATILLPSSQDSEEASISVVNWPPSFHRVTPASAAAAATLSSPFDHLRWSPHWYALNYPVIRNSLICGMIPIARQASLQACSTAAILSSTVCTSKYVAIDRSTIYFIRLFLTEWAGLGIRSLLLNSSQ